MIARSQNIKVYFWRGGSLDGSLPGQSVLIVPYRDTWNDFRLRTRVQLRISLPEISTPFVTDGHIGFLRSATESRNGVDHLIELLDGMPDGQLVIPATHQHFYTMLPSMEAYRNIVRQLTIDGAQAVLAAVGDLVAATEFEPNADWIDEATQQDVFLKSFVRQSEAFFAFKNAGSLLRGLELERLGQLSQSLGIRFQLAGFSDPHDLKFSFDHSSSLPKRISILIGKNGVGKSQTLGRIARAALDGSEELIDAETSERPLISRMLVFAPTNEVGSVFPPDKRIMPRIWYRRFSLNRVPGGGRKGRIADLIIQVARSFQSIKEHARWEIFLNALKGINGHEQICLVTKDKQTPYLGLTELLKTNEERQLERFASVDLRREPVRVVEDKGYQLSSGELSFLKFAAQVSLNIENGSLLLLDEPETHLHPNFVSGFVSLLEHLLAATGSSAIIATHSSYFVREVFREQVTVLRIDERGKVLAERPRLRTFGADVGAISYFVFGEDAPSRLATEVKDTLLKSGLSWDAIYEQYEKELSYEFLMSIRSTMEGRER